MVEINSPHQNVEDCASIVKIEQILPTPVASPSKPTQYTNDDEIQAAPSTVTPEKRTSKRRTLTRIDFSEEIAPKRPRGRPPKTEPTKLSHSEYKKLSPSDRKYYEMRLKNNEASRRSRLNRKGKEGALFTELSLLEDRNNELRAKDEHLDREISMWRKKLMKLAAL